MSKQNKRLQNPYPESVFPPMDLKPVSDYLMAGGYSPDRIFGNWGRQVWDNAMEKTLKEVGEWLEGLYRELINRVWDDNKAKETAKVLLEYILILKQGGMPE